MQRFGTDPQRSILEGESGVLPGSTLPVRFREEVEDVIHGIQPDPHAADQPRFIEASLSRDLTFQAVLLAVDAQDARKGVIRPGGLLFHLGLLQCRPEDLGAGRDQLDPRRPVGGQLKFQHFPAVHLDRGECVFDFPPDHCVKPTFRRACSNGGAPRPCRRRGRRQEDTANVA